MIIPCSVFLRMKNVSDKVVEKVITHILCSITFFSENLAVYKITCKNTVEPDWPQRTIGRIAFWICKATNTHSNNVIVIAFPLQQWLYERVSMLRYTYTVCLVTRTCIYLPIIAYSYICSHYTLQQIVM